MSNKKAPARLVLGDLWFCPSPGGRRSISPASLFLECFWIIAELWPRHATVSDLRNAVSYGAYDVFTTQARRFLSATVPMECKVWSYGLSSLVCVILQELVHAFGRREAHGARAFKKAHRYFFRCFPMLIHQLDGIGTILHAVIFSVASAKS